MSSNAPGWSDDLADDRSLVGSNRLAARVAGQEHEAGLVVAVILDVGGQYHAVVLLPGRASSPIAPQGSDEWATHSTAFAVELAASIPRPGRLARSHPRHWALAWG